MKNPADFTGKRALVTGGTRGIGAAVAYALARGGARLVLGYRSIAATLAEDADVAADEEAEAVLAALFPPGDSMFRPM